MTTRFPILLLVLALGMLVGLAKVHAVEPCCSITAIDTTLKTVTATEAKTGRTFQFKVADARALGALKIGQAVHADFKTMQVSLNPSGVQPCCALVNLRAPVTPTR